MKNANTSWVTTGSLSVGILAGALLASPFNGRAENIDVENNGHHSLFSVSSFTDTGVASYSLSGSDNSGSSSETMTRLTSTCSRVEHDTGQSFGSGVHTFDGTLYVNSPIDTCIVMQFFGSPGGPYSFLRVYSTYTWNGVQYNDGCISKGSSPVLAPHIYGTAVHVTATMDFNAGTLTYWINGTQVSQTALDTTQTYNMKYGNYGGNSGAPNNNSVRWDNVTWRTTGSGGGLTGKYQLQNIASRLALNVSGSATTNGAPVIQWPYGSGSANAQWSFTPTDSGYYQLVNVNSGKDAVVQGASTGNGALIIQWSFGSAQNDQWLPQLNSDGTYTFINRHSSKVLEDPGSNLSQGTQMDQWSSGGGANQKWQLIGQ
jgi:hypothetical protein